jgi:hypothetical protein
VNVAASSITAIVIHFWIETKDKGAALVEHSAISASLEFEIGELVGKEPGAG